MDNNTLEAQQCEWNSLHSFELGVVRIIDFPYHGSTYNGGWCLATETDETLITRPSCEVNV